MFAAPDRAYRALTGWAFARFRWVRSNPQRCVRSARPPPHEKVAPRASAVRCEPVSHAYRPRAEKLQTGCGASLVQRGLAACRRPRTSTLSCPGRPQGTRMAWLSRSRTGACSLSHVLLRRGPSGARARFAAALSPLFLPSLPTRRDFYTNLKSSNRYLQAFKSSITTRHCNAHTTRATTNH